MSRQRLIYMPSFRAAVLLLSCAVGPAAFAQSPVNRPVALPIPTGGYHLGTRRYHWVDHSRRETMRRDTVAPREVMMQLWYPAAARPGRHLAAYVPDSGFFAMLRRDQDLTDSMRGAFAALRTAADSGAPFAPGHYPLILFSHGLGVPGFYYTALLEEIASHGFVVAAIEHPYAGGMMLPRGYVSTATDSAMTRMRLLPENLRDGFLASRISVHAEDMGFVLGRLARLGLGARGHVGVMGHSLGGTAAIELCRTDPRIRACADLDGRLGWAWPVYLDGLPRPLLYLRTDGLAGAENAADSAGTRSTVAAERAAMERSLAPSLEIMLRGSTHMDFSDYNSVGQPRDPAARADPVWAFRAFAEYVIAFFDRYLRDGRHAGILDAEPADSRVERLVYHGRGRN